MDAAHGCGTWMRHMDAAHGCGTWMRHMDAAHGCGIWMWHMDMQICINAAHLLSICVEHVCQAQSARPFVKHICRTNLSSTMIHHTCPAQLSSTMIHHTCPAQLSSTTVKHMRQACLSSIFAKHICQAICLHDKGVTSHKAEPVHARYIVGFNESHKQHALWPACPVLVNLYHTNTTCW